MKLFVVRCLLCCVGLVTAMTVTAQAQAPAGRTDVYGVLFMKAAPGQADALGKSLLMPLPGAPMPDHFVLLRHQEGDDWDYCLIRHLGPKTAIEATPAPPNPARDLSTWHDDSFVSGPSWGDFTKAMGMGGSGAAGQVYVVSVHRAVPGHRDQLEKSLAAQPPAADKIQTGELLMQHIEGGAWQYLTITRYNSWQDFGTDRMQALSSPTSAGGWADVRQHSAFHRDTIADRVNVK
jgi:hypothetical protein